MILKDYLSDDFIKHIGELTYCVIGSSSVVNVVYDFSCIVSILIDKFGESCLILCGEPFAAVSTLEQNMKWTTNKYNQKYQWCCGQNPESAKHKTGMRTSWHEEKEIFDGKQPGVEEDASFWSGKGWWRMGF